MLLASGFVEVRMHLKGTFTPFCFFFVTLVKFQFLKVQLTNNVWCLSPSLWAKWALTAREGYGVCRNAHSSSSFWYKEIFVRVFFIKPEFEPASTSFRSFAESPFRSKKREKKPVDLNKDHNRETTKNPTIPCKTSKHSCMPIYG